MATESPALETATPPAADDNAWLGQVLPVVRVRKYRSFPYFFESHEVVAIYPDEFVVVRKRASVPIPEEAYEPGGAGALHALRGRVTSIPLDKVHGVTSWPRSVFGVCDGLRATGDGKSIRFQVMQDQTPNLYRASHLLLGGRFDERKHRPPFGSYGLLIAFLIALGLAVLGSSVGSFGAVAMILGVLAPVSWVVTLILLVFGLIEWIPGRRPAPRKVKKKPHKDLSGREPIRLRALGYVLSAMGSLFVLCVAGVIMLFFLLPMLPGGAQAGASWYMKVVNFAAPILMIMTIGGAGMATTGSLSVVLLSIGYLVFAVGLIFGWLAHPSVEGLTTIVVIGCPYVGLLMIHTGRRLISRNAGTAIAGDARPPVLYLRSFEDDVEDTLTPHNWLAEFFAITLPTPVRKLPLPLRVIYEAQPLRVIRSLFGRVTPTTELQLAEYFRKLGPFIAIGKPGDRLATIGADRQYVTQDKWQEVVLEYLSRSRYVVLQAAGTRGLLWEVGKVLTVAEPEKILICLSNFRGRQNDYENFRLNAEAAGGWRLPRSVGNHDEPQFLFFGADRSPVMHSLSYRSPALWPILGGATDLDHTLAGFADRSLAQSAPYAPKRFPGHTLLALLITLVIVPAIGGLVMYLVLLVASRFLPGASIRALLPIQETMQPPDPSEVDNMPLIQDRQQPPDPREVEKMPLIVNEPPEPPKSLDPSEVGNVPPPPAPPKR